MFINFTNHPSGRWSGEQYNAAARVHGKIVDLPFPNVPTEADPGRISEMAEENIARMESLFRNLDDGMPAAVLCQGEFTLAYAVIHRLLRKGITVVSAVSDRNVREIQVGDETRKEVVFRFVGFREYRE